MYSVYRALFIYIWASSNTHVTSDKVIESAVDDVHWLVVTVITIHDDEKTTADWLDATTSN